MKRKLLKCTKFLFLIPLLIMVKMTINNISNSVLTDDVDEDYDDYDFIDFDKNKPDTSQWKPLDPSVYVKPIEKILRGDLVPAKEVKSQDNSTINIGMIIINLNQESGMKSAFIEDVVIRTDKMLLYSGDNSSIQFIIVTDKRSAPEVGRIFFSVIGERLSTDVIQSRWRIWRRSDHLPRLFFTFVDIGEIIATKPQFVEEFTVISVEGAEDKYKHPLFYIAPLYHLAFENLNKIIFLDAGDVEVRCDVNEIQNQFDDMEKNHPKAIMGLAHDLALHYRSYLEDYIHFNPGTELGNPGRNQGLNSGVVLFNFDKMRASKEYNKFLEPGEISYLFKKYMLRPALGDQDFFTLVDFENRDLVYIMDCRYNTQSSLQYMMRPFTKLFDLYHFCDYPNKIKVLHNNGCGPTPESCGFNVTSERYDAGHYIHQDFGIDWNYFQKVQSGDYF